MKTKGWILVTLSIIALAVFGTQTCQLCLASSGVSPRTMTEYLLSIAVWGYGLYKGIRLLRQKRIPDYQGNLEKPDMQYSFSLTFWQFFYMYQLDFRHLSFTTLFVAYYCTCLILSESAGMNGQSWLLAFSILALYLLWFVTKYRLFVRGENEIELSENGIAIRRGTQYAAYNWSDINWAMFFSKYGIMHSNGSVKMLVVTPEDSVRNTMLYYLNHRECSTANNQKL